MNVVTMSVNPNIVQLGYRTTHFFFDKLWEDLNRRIELKYNKTAFNS